MNLHYIFYLISSLNIKLFSLSYSTGGGGMREF